MLFTIVNLARFLKADSEMALLGCNQKFRSRFSFVEQKVREQGGSWQDFTLAQLDEYWNEAKRRQGKPIQ